MNPSSCVTFSEAVKKSSAVVYHLVEHDHPGFVWNKSLDLRPHHFQKGSFFTATFPVRVALVSEDRTRLD